MIPDSGVGGGQLHCWLYAYETDVKLLYYCSASCLISGYSDSSFKKSSELVARLHYCLPEFATLQEVTAIAITS